MLIKFVFLLILFLSTVYASEQLLVKTINQNIEKILITPDNSKIILVSAGQVDIVDSYNQHQILKINGFTSEIQSVTTTNSTLTLASGNDIRQYDLRDGKLINKIDMNYGQILVSPDGLMAASIEPFRSTGNGQIIRSEVSIWDITLKKKIDVISFQESANILPVSFSQDSQLLVLKRMSQQQGFLTIYDLKNKKEIFRYDHHVSKQIFISPDNKTLFLKTFNPSFLKAFSLTDGKELLSAPDKEDVKFFPRQNKVALIGKKTMTVVDYPTMKELATFDHQCYNTYYGKINILSDEGMFLCEGKDAFELHSLSGHGLSQKILTYENPNLFNFSLSDDKTLLVTADGRGGDNGINIYKLKPRLSKVGNIDKISDITAIASNANHTKLYVAGRYSLWVYDLDDPSKNKYVKTNIFRPISIVTGDKKNILYLADGGYNSSVYKFDMNADRFLGSFGLSRFTDTDVGTSISIAPDKNKIYIRLRADKKTREFDIHTFKMLNKYEDHQINTDGLIPLIQDDIGVVVKLNPEGGISTIKNGTKMAFYGFNSGEWIRIIDDKKYMLSDQSMTQYLYENNGNPVKSSQGGIFDK